MEERPENQHIDHIEVQDQIPYASFLAKINSRLEVRCNQRIEIFLVQSENGIPVFFIYWIFHVISSLIAAKLDFLTTNPDWPKFDKE